MLPQHTAEMAPEVDIRRVGAVGKEHGNPETGALTSGGRFDSVEAPPPADGHPRLPPPDARGVPLGHSSREARQREFIRLVARSHIRGGTASRSPARRRRRPTLTEAGGPPALRKLGSATAPARCGCHL